MDITLKCPPRSAATLATLTLADGSPFPLPVTCATVVCDFNRGAVPTATLECLGLGLEISAEVDHLFVTLNNGVRYRLVEEPKE
jgi:hypothetical protein